MDLLILILIALFYTAKSHHTSPTPTASTALDAELCAELHAPSTLAFVSYNTQEGFNECVARCVTSAMLQICPQLRPNSNLFASRPEIKQQMLEGCTKNIQHFISNRTRCSYVNCEP